jgi:hypothetical protein
MRYPASEKLEIIRLVEQYVAIGSPIRPSAEDVTTQSAARYIRPPGISSGPINMGMADLGCRQHGDIHQGARS